ncbi:MAG: hypothetical protein A2901_04900 [Elusimicrobia bacterium RIFCSPLOWO2_01_FULL_54_10]|nr:MAG: hypothetical protein A2901_04900 [Elusimicrobia bacterium RIFCSPLOWO2_01_FULL_54_10]
MANFVYFVGDAKSREVFLVDPAWQIDTLFKAAEKENLKITGALVSHAHYDHCNGIEDLLARADVPIYVNADEAEFTESLGAHGESLFGRFPASNTRKVRSGDKVKIGNVELTCLHTPGHTPGSQCFLAGNRLLSGDTLFVRGCGRSDLPGGDPEKLFESLTHVLAKLPDDTMVFPGHFYGDLPQSSMKDEKIKNPYLLCTSKDAFLGLVGASVRSGL